MRHLLESSPARLRTVLSLLRLVTSISCIAAVAYYLPTASAAEKSGRLFYLGVAYDGAPPPGKDVNDFNFATENLSALLTTFSEPAFNEVSVSELKGEAATHEAFMQQLSELKDKVNEADVVMLYYGSHGGSSRKDGWGAGLAGGSMRGGELRDALGKIPCPVIAVISTCGSGGFARPRKKEPPLPPNVTALCACKQQQSTGSQLDIALSEALVGFADQDQNGDVTLREVLQYIPPRYREFMTDEQREKDSAELMPVLERSKHAPLDRVLTKASPDRLSVWHRDDWRGGLRVGDENGKPRVQFLGWDRNDPEGAYSMPDELVDPEMIHVPGAFPPIEVEYGGAWYPARVLAKQGKAFRIHYLGYPESDDETVQPVRLRYNLSNKGSVKEIQKRGARKRQREVKLSGIEQKYFNAINAARQQNGLPALTINAALMAEARGHATAMANRGEVADSFDDSHPGDRIHGAGVTPFHWGITDGKGKSIDEVIKQWVESTIASQNILQPDVTELGLGVAPDPAGGNYVAATYVQIVD